MPRKNNYAGRKIEVARRRRRVGEMMLRGIRNAEEMASAFGVSGRTIASDMNAIRENWLSEGIGDLAEKATIRVRQLDNLLSMAVNAFDRSRKPKKEITFEQRPCDNPRCHSGLVKTDDGQTECSKCHGQEFYMIEKERITQTSGDPAFLMVAKAVIVEAGRIEGVYPATVSAMRKTVEKAFLGNNGEDATAIREVTEQFMVEAPYELVVKAMAALEDCRVHAKLEGPVEDMPPPVDRTATKKHSG